MKHLTLELEDEIGLLSNYRITPTELMFVRTLLLLQDDSREELFKNYIESLHDCGVNLRDVLVSLQNKGLILKSYKIPAQGQPFDPYAIPFNKAFTKATYKCSWELGKELFDAYPQTTIINGNLVMLRGVSKHFNSLEDAWFKYGKYIKWDPEIHEKVIDLIEWAKEKDLIQCSLSSFIINNGWADLEKIRDGEVGNIDFNSVKVI